MYHYEEDYGPSLDDLNNKARVFFQVIIDYNRDLIKSMVPKEQAEKMDKLGSYESIAIGSFDEAEDVAKELAAKIHSKFPGSAIRSLDPEEQRDEYNTWVSHPNGDPIAKVGVIATDYSEVTFH